jgi:hypothetical protein
MVPIYKPLIIGEAAARKNQIKNSSKKLKLSLIFHFFKITKSHSKLESISSNLLPNVPEARNQAWIVPVRVRKLQSSSTTARKKSRLNRVIQSSKQVENH